MSFSAPSNLTKTAQGDTTATMTWDPGTAVDAGDLLLFYRVAGPNLEELVGQASISVVGAGAVSSAQAKFGTTSFLNPGTIAENNNFIRALHADPYFLFPAEFTFEGWFYIRALHDAFNNLFSNNIAFPGTGFIQLGITAGQDVIWNSSAGGALFSSGGLVSLNQWVHLAVSRDYVNRLRIFVNGVLAGAATKSGQVGGGTGGVSSLDVGRGIAADNGDIDAYMEEIRVTNFCRYGDDAGFIPPDDSTLSIESTVHAIYRDGVRVAVVSDINEYTDTGLTTGTYQYKVAVWDPINLQNISDYSNEITVSIVNTGINTIPIIGFADEAVFQGYFGGHLKGTTVACPGDNANKVKPCC